MANKDQRETTFGSSELTEIYVKKPISKEGVKATLKDLEEGVSEIVGAVEEKVNFQPNKRGKMEPEFIGNVQDLEFLRKELKDSKGILGEFAYSVGEQITKSAEALKVGLKNFGKGLLFSAGCGLMNDLFINWSQASYEKYGELMDGGEGVIFLAIAGIGALGYAINSAINAGKAGVSLYRNERLLETTEDSIADVDYTENVLSQSVLNRMVSDQEKVNEAAKYAVWKEGFLEDMQNIDRSFEK